jgi:hypothetical protein
VSEKPVVTGILADVDAIEASHIRCAANIDTTFLVWRADEHVRLQKWYLLADLLHKRLSGEGPDENVSCMVLESIVPRMLALITPTHLAKGSGPAFALSSCLEELTKKGCALAGWSQIGDTLTQLLCLILPHATPANELQAAIENVVQDVKTPIGYAINKTAIGVAVMDQAREILLKRKRELEVMAHVQAAADHVADLKASMQDPKRFMADASSPAKWAATKAALDVIATVSTVTHGEEVAEACAEACRVLSP